MYKEVLSSIDGVEIYPIFSLLVFFSFFLVLSVWFYSADGDKLRRLANLPLDQGGQEIGHE